MLRDAVTFLGLTLVTAVLFAVTLFLFRSFAAHRAELAQRWSERGRIAISQGKPDQAIVALRFISTTVTYLFGPSLESFCCRRWPSGAVTRWDRKTLRCRSVRALPR
jgi:hypothetical protein